MKSIRFVDKVLGFGVILAIGIGFIGLSHFATIRTEENRIHDYLAMIKLNFVTDSIEFNVLKAHAHQKDFRLTGRVEFKNSFAKEIDKARKAINQLKPLSNREEDAKRLSQLKILLDDYQTAFFLAARKQSSYQAMEKAAQALTRLTDGFRETKETRVADLIDMDEGDDRKLSGNFILTLLTVLAVLSLLLLYLARSVLNPVEQIRKVAHEVVHGNYTERVKLRSNDEFSALGQGFDRLLDERVSDITEAEKETEQLNHSIIGLLQAVHKLSQKDLTVEIPVAKDITGAISDALNQLTFETCEVLKRAADISHRVNEATIKVKSQSQEVLEYTEAQNKQTDQSIAELTGTIDAMNEIAMLANQANRESEKAVDMTESALTAVNETVESAKSLRNTMRETEKRIKRLGERSQEITSAVNIINEIAEKTHILALNASMHAASAGDAGKGFMVVADEVQRLAESSREATSQVAAFVQNIQTETSDTVETMSKAINEVIEGTRLAGQAGVRMKENRETTLALVNSVHTINRQSKSQAQASESLRQRTHGLQESAENAYSQLRKQAAFTDTLVKDAKDLVSTVQVFKLPA